MLIVLVVLIPVISGESVVLHLVISHFNSICV